MKKSAFRMAILAGTVLLLSAVSGGDEFPFWVYTSYQGANPNSDLYTQIQDCGFNAVQDSVDAQSLQKAAKAGLKVYACNYMGPPLKYSMSHYMVWQAEEDVAAGRPGLRHQNGMLANDTTWESVEGDTAGWFICGPDYVTEIRYQVPGYAHDPIPYTAAFRMKIDTPAGTDTTKVATLSVWRGATPIRSMDVRVRDFGNSPSHFDTLEISNYTYEAGISPKGIMTPEDASPFTDWEVEFRVKWWGNRRLTVDWIKVHDLQGKELIDHHDHDQEIRDYVSLYSLHSNLERWYLRDEPPVIDSYVPYFHIDTLLEGSFPRALTAFNHGTGGNLDKYLTRARPEVLLADCYPLDIHTPKESPGLQNALSDRFTPQLKEYKQAADREEGKELHFVIQAHSYDDGIGTPLRNPTPQELRCMTNLALAYGAEGIAYYDYTSAPQCSGLVNAAGIPTDKWDEIHGHIAPRIHSIGPTLRDLTWDDACLFDPSAVNGHYIRDISSDVFPGSACIEIGYFHDNSSTNYFMLVNRRCLETEAETLAVTTDKGGVCLIEDMYSGPGNAHDALCTSDGSGIFTGVTLLPGEGRLFQLTLIPAIELSASLHNFGGVPRGASADWNLTILNTGTADLLINSLTSDTSDFHVASPFFPETVSPRSSIPLTIRFTPSNQGSISGQMTIASNDMAEGVRIINVRGTGIAP